MAWRDSQPRWLLLAANTLTEWYYWLQRLTPLFFLCSNLSRLIFIRLKCTRFSAVCHLSSTFSQSASTLQPQANKFLLPVIGDSNCCRNVIFRLRHSLKLCLFLSNYCGFDLIIPSKPLTELWLGLIALPWTTFSCTAVVLFLESNVNSACSWCPCEPHSSLT